jgi:hypothetical protein
LKLPTVLSVIMVTFMDGTSPDVTSRSEIASIAAREKAAALRAKRPALQGLECERDALTYIV